MALKDWIAERLTEELSPSRLVVEDESDQHRGHSGWRDGGETHFRLDIVSEAFAGKSRVERHRLVNSCSARHLPEGCTRSRSAPGRRGSDAKLALGEERSRPQRRLHCLRREMAA